MRRGPQDGSASHHAPQHMQCTAGTAPMAELSSAPGQPQGASLKSLDPSTIAAVGRIEGPPFQLPQTQVLPHSAYQAPSPQAGLGKAILESQLPGWGAASAAGSWRRKQDPGANGRQSLALDETLDPGSRLAGGGETAAALPAHTLCRARHRGARGGGGGQSRHQRAGPGAGVPQVMLLGVWGLQGGSRQPIAHFYLESQGWPRQGGRGRSPVCWARALSQPGSPEQLGDRFQGDAGSGVHGGLARQRLMGNRCKGALCWSGPGGAGVGTSLPAPVALPPCPPGALAGPCASWGEERARRQPLMRGRSSAGPFTPQEQPRNCTRVYSKKIIYQVDISRT